MKTGINLKQFKKWITKEIGGRKCKGYSFDCLACFAWETYTKLEALLWFCEMLDELDVNKKEIKTHKE